MKRKIVVCSLALCLMLSGCAGNSLNAYTTYAYFDTLTRWAFFPRAAEKEQDVWEQITSFARAVEKSVSLAEPAFGFGKRKRVEPF